MLFKSLRLVHSFSVSKQEIEKMPTNRITNPSFHVQFSNIRNYMCNFVTVFEIMMSNIMKYYIKMALSFKKASSFQNLLARECFNNIGNLPSPTRVANSVLYSVLIPFCDKDHVSYHHYQPLWILWFLFLTKLTLFRSYVYQVAQHQVSTEKVVPCNVLRNVRRADVTS